MRLNDIHTSLVRPVSIAPLVTFRVIFGVIMTFATIRFVALGWIEDHYTDPIFHFTYYGFSWVKPLPVFWMYVVHVIMGLAALGVMLGLYYRLSAVLLFLTFTYTELIDLTYYLNHYYFVSIACALLILLPANRWFSLDVRRKPEIAATTVPAWTVFTLKLQVAIVYTYAGLAKINHDWLFEALPLKIWMPANDKLPIIGWFLALPVMPYIFSWLGMLYDCTIVYWLSYSKTRPWAYASVVFFHSVTGLMFQIGVFPLVMMGCALIFFPAAWHKRLIDRVRIFLHRMFPALQERTQVVPQTASLSFPGPLKLLLALHFTFQILFPWRYLLYPGNLFWTEEGYRFSWRVMLMEKAGTATFYVKDSATNREGIVVNSEFLNAHQEKQMAMQPDMILQFAHFLKSWYAERGVQDPQVRAEVYVTLNARPSRLLIDPNINLASVEDGWKPKDWIIRYDE